MPYVMTSLLQHIYQHLLNSETIMDELEGIFTQVPPGIRMPYATLGFSKMDSWQNMVNEGYRFELSVHVYSKGRAVSSAFTSIRHIRDQCQLLDNMLDEEGIYLTFTNHQINTKWLDEGRILDIELVMVGLAFEGAT